MGTLAARILDENHATLAQLVVPGDIALVGPDPAPASLESSFKGVEVSAHPMNDATIGYAAHVLQDVARSIIRGEVSDPRPLKTLAYIQIEETHPIPLNRVVSWMLAREMVGEALMITQVFND